MLDSGAPPHAVSDYYTIGYQQWKASAFQGAGSIRMQVRVGESPMRVFVPFFYLFSYFSISV